MIRPTAKAQAVAALLRQDLQAISDRCDRLKPRDLGPAQVEWIHRQLEAHLRSLCDLRRAAREKAADAPRSRRRSRLLALDALGHQVEPCPACEEGIVRAPAWRCVCGHQGHEQAPVAHEARLEGA